ncbi:hypothetical protein GSS87_00990 [Corynebacterium sp. 4HC-13]|uniref:hypothetical protein n=1 Tax=Corynebacterium anserum TaxID=2684406 RepID=UPI0016398782|nr:hypothetical protein [Corynebacterium anserum]MBC2681009.1 hypothetical protein [Corynebacterium anserum]
MKSERTFTMGECERWALDHPVYGLIEVYVGTPEQLRHVDAGFPQQSSQGSGRKQKQHTADEPERGGSFTASSTKHLPATFSQYRALRKRELLVMQQRVVIARRRSLESVKIVLKKDPEPLEESRYDFALAVSAPYLQIISGGVNAWIREMWVKVQGTVIQIDAPRGSKAEKRQRAMEDSPYKRWLYPLAAGMGKGGWAFFCIVLLPFLGKVMQPVTDWLAQFIPDWHINIPWPDIKLPQNFFPEIHLPSIPWPDWSAPGWLIFLLDYTKVWMPIVVGLWLGIVAVRNAHRSRQEKLREERQCLVSAFAARLEQLEGNGRGSADAGGEGVALKKRKE